MYAHCCRVIRLLSFCLVCLGLLTLPVWHSLLPPFSQASAKESVRPAEAQPSATWFTPLPSSFRLAAARPRTFAPGATLTVNSRADSGGGGTLGYLTLRQALLSAIPGDNIVFDTAVFPPNNPMTITLLSALPEISLGSLTIDASNAGVVLDGRYTASGTSGLRVTSNDNTIKGLQIVRFPNHGVEVTNGAKRNLIGGDWTVGSAPRGEGNIITLNGGDGVNIRDTGTMSNTVSGNLIGLDADGTLDIRIQAMAISPNYANDQTLFVGTKWHGVWKTTDGGSSWARASSGLTISDVRALAVSPSYITDATVFAGTANGGIFKTTNGGSSWARVDGGVASQNIFVLAISPAYASDGHVFAGTWGAGVFASINGGTSWAARSSGLSSNERVNGLVLSPNYAVDRTLFVAGTDRAFKSINQGYNWTGATSSGFEVRTVAISPNYANDQTVFVGIHRCSAPAVLKSADGGNTWSEIGDNIGCGAALIAVSPNYATDQTLFANGIANSLIKSSNGGANWNGLWGDRGSIAGLAVSPAYAQDHTLFVAIYGGSIFKTTDGGNTFTDFRNGLTEAGNTGAGVMIGGGAQWNVIGGNGAGARNVIGHNLRGVDIHDSGTDYNTVSANYIGVDASGSATLGNTQDGVDISNGARYNLVGGAMAGERNIISSNSQSGVQIFNIGTMSNTVSGNYVGTDASGTVSLGNTGAGIGIASGAEYNRVGGATAEERNVISGGVGGGVTIADAGYNIVIGNYVGTDASGANALGNGAEGIIIGCWGGAGGWHNVIEHNVIGNNGTWGVVINGGIAAYDDTPLLDDVSLQFNGGPNQLSNGDFSGGLLHWSTWDNNLKATRSSNTTTYHSALASYQFNRGDGSGTLRTFYDTLSQTVALPTYPYGSSSSIWMSAPPGAQVTFSYWYSGTLSRPALLGLDNTGGWRNLTLRTLAATTAWTQDTITTSLPADIVAVSVRFDVDSIRTVHNIVRNNYIGTDASGTIPMGNNGPGVRLGLGARYNTIGEGNVIVYNLSNGIDVRDSTTLYNTITRNSIHSNTGMGIETDGGGNQELSPPAITSATETSVSGIAPMPGVTVEIFSDDGNQGRLYEGTTTADASGNFTFNQPAGLHGPYLTATTTDSQGNTSEFSNRVTKPGPTPTPTTPPMGPTPTPGGPTPTPTRTPTATPQPSTGDAFEVDDMCTQAKVVLGDGTVQNHTFHQQADVDWTTFDAISGTTYIIEAQIPAGSPADVSLSVYDSCTGLRQGGQDFAFAPGVRLSLRVSATSPLYLRLENHDPSRYGDSVAYQLSVRALGDAPMPGALILVAGRARLDDPLQANIYHVTDAVRDVFLRQGYNDSRIYYLAPDNTLGGWDDTPSVSTLQAAITTWAQGKVAADRALTLFLMDHGDRNLVYLDKVHNEWVTPAQLDAWLTELENAVPGLKINVVLEACYSGSFIDTPEEISKAGRVIVTSTASWLLAHASAQGALFSDHFVAALDQRKSLYESFQAGAWAVQEARPYGDQTPWLDDNGDGVMNTSDGNEAMQRGFAYAGTFGEEEWPPYIQQANGPDSLSGGKGVIQAKVLDDRGVDMVWAVIYPPSYKPPTGGTEIVKEILSTIVLLELGSGWYGASYPGFTEIGQYRMVVYAKDDDGLEAQPVTIGLQVGYVVYLPVVVKNQ